MKTYICENCGAEVFLVVNIKGAVVCGDCAKKWSEEQEATRAEWRRTNPVF